MRHLLGFLFFSATALFAAPPAAQEFLSLKSIGDLQASPDGATLAFTVTTSNFTTNQHVSSLMRMPASGGTPVPMAGAPEGVSNLRWSPDGSRIAFFATRDGKQALWVLDASSGKLTRICDYDRSNGFLSKAGNMLAWSPDGTKLAFAGTTEPTPPKQDPVVVSRIQYKSRTGLADNRRTHIFVVAANGGTPHALTQGKFDEHSIDWGGDGREIVFLSNHEPDPDAKLNYDLFAVNTTSGQTRQLTRTPGVEMDPRISPDGKRIAYLATKRAITTIDSVAEDAHVWVISSDGGEGRELNGALDRRSSSPKWAAGGKSIVFEAADHGKTVIYRDNAAVMNDQMQATSVEPLGQTESFAAVLSDSTHPGEIYRLDPGVGPRRLTSLNAESSIVRGAVAPESLTFPSFDATEVQAFLYMPKNAAGHVPMILSIHGGPHGQFGYAFSAAFQYYLARGYAVLAVNPRGSSGYGQKFSDGCVGDWGGGDYKDLMAGVDYALKTHPAIDQTNLFVTGGSYGGFMTNWVITQTQRFRAAVSVASVSDMISFYATSLYQDLVHAEFNGFPWTGSNYEELWKWSPLAHVGHATTPTLFLHGEQDNDVHITQAEQMYTALRERGVESVLVRYPREGHGFREPKHMVDSLERTIDWMDSHRTN